MPLRIFAAIVALLCLSLVSTRALAYTPPPIDGHVTDPAGRLTAQEKLAIDEKLARYRKTYGDQIAVFIAASLEEESIEDVAYRTFNAWKIGNKGKDDGVLLVIAPTERKNRIETGKGIGDRLTDLQSKDILQQRVTPRCKELRWRAAVEDGVDAIMSVLQGQPIPPPSAPPSAPPPAAVETHSASSTRHPPLEPHASSDDVVYENKESFAYLFMNSGPFFLIVLLFGGLLAFVMGHSIWAALTGKKGRSHGSSSFSSDSSPSSFTSFPTTTPSPPSSSFPTTTPSSSSSSSSSDEPKYTGGGGTSGGGGASDGW